MVQSARERARSVPGTFLCCRVQKRKFSRFSNLLNDLTKRESEDSPGHWRQTWPGARRSSPRTRRSSPGQRRSSPTERRSSPRTRQISPERRRSSPTKRRSSPERRRSSPTERRSSPRKRRSSQRTRGSSKSPPQKWSSYHSAAGAILCVKT